MKATKTVIEAAAAAPAPRAPEPTLLTEAEFLLRPDVEAMTAAEIAEELAAIVDPIPAIEAAAKAYQEASAEADRVIREAQQRRDAAFARLQKLQRDAVLTLERINRLKRGKPRRPRVRK